ncbi:MAG TPA: GAF and ANTAR domain-containing protein [Solirubrobacteraceae bacterium]|nr:GAF and ANTAR domain-containing protein [Solirubrobacteraceae bacterium]
MPTDRLSAVLREIAKADVDGSSSLVDRVCLAAVVLLSLRGAGLSLMVDGELRGTAGVSDPGIAVVQESQLSLGEGPCVDAWTNRAPVLEANLADPAIVRWPAFAHAGIDAGVLAVFAFPLHLGAIRIGVLVLYRDYPGMLSADEMACGLVLADVATQVLLSLQAGAPAGALHEILANELPHWAEVHQATGMASVQLGVSLDEAFVRLRAHAFAEGLPLRIIAREIVTRQRRLEEPA